MVANSRNENGGFGELVWLPMWAAGLGGDNRLIGRFPTLAKNQNAVPINAIKTKSCHDTRNTLVANRPLSTVVDGHECKIRGCP